MLIFQSSSIMEITVKMLNGMSCTLMVNPQDTVGSLKIRIQEKLGVPAQSQKLVFVNGQRTDLGDDSQPVCFYGLQSGSIVSLLVTQPPAQPASFQVFLRNLQGTLRPYDVKPDETVSNFKSRVQSREGVPVSQQRLLYQSREMMDGKLSDYNVKEHCTIDMTSRLRGG